ncbi:EipB family protein [Dongia sp.]|uniref:EipB family protein n=1 Tax=Dongia sp. TaxID=1977262 RepID=UPI0035AD8B15
MFLSIWRNFLGSAAFLATVLAAGAPAWGDLLPHRVVYILDLGNSGTLSGGNGLMTFEIKDVCDGWAMDLKAEIALAGEDGELHRLGWSQVSWESKDGKRYRYFTRDMSDSRETSRRRGEARRDMPDGAVEVVADLPEQAEFTLPTGTLFPVQHTLALISGDAAGESYVLANLFDGSIGNEAVEVGAALGPGDLNWMPKTKELPALKGVRSFPAALAFYMSGSPEGVPDTEQSMRLYSNGVVGSLTFSLGDLKVHATIDELTPLQPEGC